MELTTSVCMAVYNGAEFIEQQLSSILHQSKRPDEVILCDDGSADDTVEIIRRFIEENQLKSSWRLYQNRQNKGYPGNFYHAMGLCKGDIVFLADQDDIWCERKMERMCQVMAERPEAKAVCCKFGLIDAQGKNIHSVMSPTFAAGTGRLRKVDIEQVFYKCEWPGMVLAYRRQWYQSWTQNSYRIPHDFLLCARAAEENGFLQMDESLAFHRRHENNAGGEEYRASRLLQKDRKLKEIEEYLTILKSFEQEKVLQKEKGKEALQHKLLSMQGRYDALQSGKIGKVLANAAKYRRDVRAATVICDLLIVRK